ncbi:hypothetical protein ACI8AF_17370 [Blastococcus sp. SYSU D00669]
MTSVQLEEDHVPTSSAAPTRARRTSREPGFYTRAQVEEDLGLTATELDTFERAGVLGAEQRRRRGDTRPVLYSTSDLAVARFAMAAHRLGVRGEQLRRLSDALRLKRKRLQPGWSGLIVVDGDGDVELLADAGGLGDYLRRYPVPVASLLVTALSVPEIVTDAAA